MPRDTPDWMGSTYISGGQVTAHVDNATIPVSGSVDVSGSQIKAELTGPVDVSGSNINIESGNISASVNNAAIGTTTLYHFGHISKDYASIGKGNYVQLPEVDLPGAEIPYINGILVTLSAVKNRATFYLFDTAQLWLTTPTGAKTWSPGGNESIESASIEYGSNPNDFQKNSFHVSLGRYFLANGIQLQLRNLLGSAVTDEHIEADVYGIVMPDAESPQPVVPSSIGNLYTEAWEVKSPASGASMDFSMSRIDRLLISVKYNISGSGTIPSGEGFATFQLAGNNAMYFESPEFYRGTSGGTVMSEAQIEMPPGTTDASVSWSNLSNVGWCLVTAVGKIT